MKSLVLIISLFLSVSCSEYRKDEQPNNYVAEIDSVYDHEPSNESELTFPVSEQFADANLTYNIITAANNTWCYDILMDGRLFIHQPSVPGLSGNEGFTTKEQAAKVAELIISKIKNGEMPPSISIEEMKNLKAL